jgi:hypothetical protein
MEKINRFLHDYIFLILFCAIPIILLGVLLYVKTVNVPFWDQWELVPIIEHIRAGHFLFGDFWHQHNEHRLFFPQLIMVAAAIFSHWNTKVECLIGFVVAFCSFCLFMSVLINRHKEITKKYLFLLLPLLLSIIWFSPVQVENWIWGWQIQWFLNVLGLMIVVFAIARAKKTFTRSDLALLIAGALLSQYSLANGTLIWPLAIVALLFYKVDWKKVLTIFIFGTLSTALYFYHYVSPPNPKSSIFHNPFEYIHYVLIYLGRSLTFVDRLTPILGLLLLTLFAGFILGSFKYSRRRFINGLPWFVMGSYAVATALITGLGRLGFGLSEAASSRYTTISSLLLVSIIVLAWENRDILKVITKRTYNFTCFAAIFVGFGLCLSNAAWGVNSMNTRSQYMTDIKNCTHLADPSQICLLSTYPSITTVEPRLAYLKEIHWGGY